MRLPDDRHLKSLFIKTYRELARQLKNENDKRKLFDALLESCLRSVQSNPNDRRSENINILSDFISALRKYIDPARLKSDSLQNLIVEISDFRNFPGVIASLHQHNPDKSKSRSSAQHARYSDIHSERRRTGSFFTPLPIADFICRNAIDIFLYSINNFPSQIDVLDPSVGCGIFLDVFIESMREKIKKGSIRRIGLHAIEQDRTSLALTKKILLYKLNDESRFEMHFHEGDFLLDEIPHPKGGYDIIIGNPPYISYYSREARNDKKIKSLLQARYASKAGGSLNTFLLFIIRSIELLNDGGVLGFIVPDKILWNRRYMLTRRYILDNAPPAAIYNAGENIFGDASVGNAIIFLQKTKDIKQCEFGDVEPDSQTAQITIKNRRYMIPGRILDEPELRFTVPDNLVKKIRHDSVPLGELAHVRDGINPAFDEFRRKIISTEKKGRNYRPLIEGVDIHPFKIVKRKLFVNYDNSIVTPELKKRGVSLRQNWIFDSPAKLVNRQTSDKLIFAFDENRMCNLNSVHNTILKDGVDGAYLDFLLGLMNSRLMNYYYRNVTCETARNFPQVHIADLVTLPVRIPSKKTLKRIVGLVARIQQAGSERKKFLDFLDDEIYKLYEITESEKNIIVESTGREWRI